MGCGARKVPYILPGTLKAPSALHVRAATKAGNLASAIPTRGFRYAGTVLSRAETAPASPWYRPSRPSKRTYAVPSSPPSTRSLMHLGGTSEHLPEDQAIVKLVGVQDDGVRMAGHGMFHESCRQRHAGCFREPVDHEGHLTARGVTVDDDDGAIFQMWMPSHLHLCSEVSEQNAGDFHGLLLTLLIIGTRVNDVTECGF